MPDIDTTEQVRAKMHRHADLCELYFATAADYRARAAYYEDLGRHQLTKENECAAILEKAGKPGGIVSLQGRKAQTRITRLAKLQSRKAVRCRLSLPLKRLHCIGQELKPFARRMGMGKIGIKETDHA